MLKYLHLIIYIYIYIHSCNSKNELFAFATVSCIDEIAKRVTLTSSSGGRVGDGEPLPDDVTGGGIVATAVTTLEWCDPLLIRCAMELNRVHGFRGPLSLMEQELSCYGNGNKFPNIWNFRFRV